MATIRQQSDLQGPTADEDVGAVEDEAVADGRIKVRNRANRNRLPHHPIHKLTLHMLWLEPMEKIRRVVDIFVWDIDDVWIAWFLVHNFFLIVAYSRL
jgi:hypothetical protein